MNEQELFEQSIKKIFEEIREEKRCRIEAAISDAHKYIDTIKIG